jgi:hypothetical protein
MNQLNFQFSRDQDALLRISMAPQVNVSGWQGDFAMTIRKGGTAIFTKSFASGYVAGQSGITMTDGNLGVFDITVNNVDTSGLDFGNYHCNFKRTNSGFHTTLSEGYITLK